ncbi:MAG TPA: HAMP domain-containing sensor histidine kinase [Isosphaeraceae bacterium]|nr:HAMP domain-containing sensor histidine kinase [Isosphaeraceae bacterium]
MLRWPIRVKLFVGLSLVVGMMLTLLGGSVFGLHAFHASNLTLTDQLRELGASTRLLRTVVHIDALRGDSLEQREELRAQINEARSALNQYCTQLKANTSRGNRADVRDELDLAFLIDHDLTEILVDLTPDEAVEPILPGTKRYIETHPEKAADQAKNGPPATRVARIDRLNRRAMMLPDILHRDFFSVLSLSKGQYESSRVIVWVSALAVLAMLGGLMALFHRWVLDPVRLLHRGVRRVARGSFHYKIDIASGDEMQALAEAFNDMTSRLSATYTDLEHQVQERSRQLVRSERLAGVGFLAAGVAHEINNPLASIAFCSEALESRLKTTLENASSSDAKVVSSYLRMIQDEAFRCKRITEKLLDFSRCGEIQRERTDLVSLVQSVVEMVQHMGRYRQKKIVFHPRESVFAHVDAQEIKQVVLNLVVNALDCMEPGGTLKIDVRNVGGSAELTFNDDGCGMEPEVLENIFEPFFTRRKVGKGTGLGLSITHRIVSQHGGEIGAESPGEGQGSTFRVRLPNRPPETPTHASQSAPSPVEVSHA